MLQRMILMLLILWPSWALSDTGGSRQAAKELLAEGAKAFRLGDFDKAIDDFKRSYDLYPDPTALYNLAQIYRQEKQNEKAIFFYQQYLNEAPRAPDKAKIEARIEELKGIIAAQKAVADKPPDGVQPAQSTAATVPPTPVAPAATTPTAEPDVPPVADTSSGRPIYPWVIAGGGAAIAAVGLGLLASAGSLDDDANRATTVSQTMDLRNQASSRKTLGAAVTIGGGIVAAAGVALVIWNPGGHGRGEPSTQQTVVIVGPSWLALRGSF